MSTIHISLAAEEIIRFGILPVTNSLLAGFISSIIIFLLFFVAARQVALHPRARLSLAIETLMEMLMNLIEGVTNNREKAKAFFPLLMTLFTFILVNNWLGLLPGIGSITITTSHGVVPLFRGATADLNTTLSLALISIGASHFYALKHLGLFRHLRKYLSFNPILLFVGFLEIVSDLSKMVSFSFRLFGNIFAGEVLLVVISYLTPLIAPLPFFALELFVGVVQAFVFAMLTLVFLEIATSHHGDHEDEPDAEAHKQFSGAPAESPLSSHT